MKGYFMSAANEARSAAIDTATASQPRTSSPLFWRRITSIWHRNQSPVCSAQPAQCAANSSSDIARNCAEVKLGLADIGRFLNEVEARQLECPDWGRGRVQDLSPLGHLVAVDVPRMVDLLRRIDAANKGVGDEVAR